MKIIYILFFFFISVKFFGQTPNSNSRVNGQSLTVVSTDPNNPDNVIMSTAIPLVGEKFTTSQSANVSLTPLPEKNANSNPQTEKIIEGNTITLVGKKYTTSQASTLKLVPVERSDRNINSQK